MKYLFAIPESLEGDSVFFIFAIASLFRLLYDHSYKFPSQSPPRAALYDKSYKIPESANHAPCLCDNSCKCRIQPLTDSF